MMNATTVKCAACAAMLLLIVSCSDRKERVPDGRFYQGVLTKQDLIGTWIMTRDSLDRLSGYCGYQLYTNATDQMITLKDDGTCVFRGFDQFKTKPLWLNPEEKQFSYTWLDGWTNSTEEAFLNIKEEELEWAHGDRWTEWELVDNGAAGAIGIFWNGRSHRYTIKFSHTNVIVIGDMIRRVGKWDDEVMLWMDINDSFKIKNLVDYRIVRYKRAGSLNMASKNEEEIIEQATEDDHLKTPSE